MPYFLFLGYKHLWFLCYLMLLSRGNFRPVMFKTSNQIVRESHLTHKPTIWTRRILQGESDFVPTNGSFKNHQGTSKISRTFVFLGVYTGVSTEDFHPLPKHNSELPQSRAVVVVFYPGDQDQLESLRLLDLGQETLGSKGSNNLGILKAGDVIFTLPETNSSPLKIDPWNLGDSYWKPPFCWGAMLVLGRVSTLKKTEQGNIPFFCDPPTSRFLKVSI